MARIRMVRMLAIMGLPGWYLILQILFTASIGFGGGLIAWAQWRTANQKVLLDLFDRRFRVFQEVRTINRKVIGAGTATFEQGQSMLQIWSESRFLFGPEVAVRIEELVDALLDIETAKKEQEGMGLQDGPARKEQVQNMREGLKVVQKTQQELHTIFAPYMRMDTKTIRSPRQWFDDRNRLRQEVDNRY